jgi:hypothetical protein
MEQERQEKRSKVLIAQIDDDIHNWMLAGLSNKKIKVKLLEVYGIKESNAEYRIGQVLKSFKIESDENAELLKGKYVELYQDLYQRSLATGKVKEAKDVIDSIVKLLGLSTHKVEAKISNTFEIDFNE